MANDQYIYKRFFLTASLVIGLCVAGIFLGLSLRSKALMHDQVIAQARAHFQGILHTRRWNAQHGGVYVIKRPGVQSSPYLENPDITVADGQVLTLINPALMTRELSELADANDLFTFRITSLKPLNPHNAPDPFEAQALRSFETGQKEALVMEDKVDGARLRYMAPLMVEQSCLSCHAKQGYRVGQVRGGISVSFGIDEVNKALRQNNLAIIGLAIATVGLLLATLWFFFRQMKQRLDEARALLQKLATVDTLTCVANRASVMERLSVGFARHRRGSAPLGCLMIDVDHFKAVNDRFGHQKGDAVLKELASLVSAGLRPYDTLGRYGGEEFLLVLDGVDAARLAEVAERTRAVVEERLAERTGMPEPVTISLGGTLVAPEDQSIDDVIRRADEALYLAKDQGRNRVVLLAAEGVRPAGSGG